MPWEIIYCLSVFLLCIVCAGIVIPKILLIAFRRRLFDMPDERKIHHCAVPRLGGIAFKPVVFFSMALLLGINTAMGGGEMLSAIGGDVKTFAFGYCSIMMLYLVGMADDLIGIRYSVKFAVQILCGVMLITGGLWIDDLHGLLGIHELPEWIGYPLTVLVVVFIINAINLIDGVDGLASGLCSGACLLYGFSFLFLGHYIYAMLSFATLGVLVPFFYYNVFGNAERGRKIFMGDTGSLTIGMMLCFLGAKLLLSVPEADYINPVILAFSPLLIPCLDVVRVYMYRVRHGKNPFLPDKNHIHHKFLAIGMHQRPTMVCIVAVSIVFILFNVLLSHYLDINIILFGDIFLWTILNIWLTSKIKRTNSARQ